MHADWQSWAAAAVVILTATAFAVRALRKKKGGSCSSCGTAGDPIKSRRSGTR